MDISALSTGRRRRQTYTREFKAKAVGACMQPGVSLAAIAMDLRVNDNVLRRWVREAERAALLGSTPAGMESPPAPSGLVAISVAPAPAAHSASAGLRITVQHNSATVEILCLATAEVQCATLLREWLR